MQPLDKTPLADGVVRAACLTNRPPSPPYIHIPSPLVDNNQASLTLTPSFESMDTGQLTAEDINIITGGRDQRAHNNYTQEWKYESRRAAQPILDFLYLGPLSVVRDRAFLQKEGITMLLAARDTSMAQVRIMSVDKAAAELGIEAAYVDVASRQELIRSLPTAVSLINGHLLRIYKSQARDIQGDQMLIDRSTFKQGKVLVFCETGNERSAAIVAAYLMAMYGRDMVNAVQFVGAQRFCCTFDEETKYLLRSFGDILDAKRSIARAAQDQSPQQQQPGQNYGQIPLAHATASAKNSSKKRGFQDTMDEDDVGEFSMDSDRYEDRPAFVPYVQGGGDINMG